MSASKVAARSTAKIASASSATTGSGGAGSGSGSGSSSTTSSSGSGTGSGSGAASTGSGSTRCAVVVGCVSAAPPHPRARTIPTQRRGRWFVMRGSLAPVPRRRSTPVRGPRPRATAQRDAR
ncbi:MAG TPA: hypothetical protein DEF51_32175 [Myxococcales bacterium]|nr:hypothetical protein [Myxococcales bacterium]